MSFLEDYKAAIKSGASDVFMMPRFRNEEPARVTYQNGSIHSASFSQEALIKSKVPRTLFKDDKSTVMGYQDKEWITVEGVLVPYKRPENTWFIAKRVSVGKRRVLNKWAALDLYILSVRGFLTVLPLCSWASVDGVKSDGSAKTIVLPRSTEALKAFYETRVGVLNEVLEGSRPAYWLQHKEVPVPHKRILPVEKIIGLTVATSVFSGGT